jgi:hypothetical protein
MAQVKAMSKELILEGLGGMGNSKNKHLFSLSVTPMGPALNTAML